MMVNMSMMKVMISHLALWPTRSIICLDAFTFNATLDAMMRRAFDDNGRHIDDDVDQDDVDVEYEDTTQKFSGLLLRGERLRAPWFPTVADTK